MCYLLDRSIPLDTVARSVWHYQVVQVDSRSHPDRCHRRRPPSGLCKFQVNTPIIRKVCPKTKVIIIIQKHSRDHEYKLHSWSIEHMFIYYKFAKLSYFHIKILYTQLYKNLTFYENIYHLYFTSKVAEIMFCKILVIYSICSRWTHQNVTSFDVWPLKRVHSPQRYFKNCYDYRMSRHIPCRFRFH